METEIHVENKTKKKKIFFFFKNKNKNNLLSKKLSTKRIKYDIFIDSTIKFSVIHDKIKNILIFYGNHPSKFIQEGNIYKYINVSNIKKISSGYEHTLILTKDNDIYSFGSNVHGQCGLNNQKYPLINTPIKINSSFLFNKNKIKDVICLFDSSCILLDNNELYEFGGAANVFIPQKIIIHEIIDKIIPSTLILSSFLVFLTKTNKIYKKYKNDTTIHNIPLPQIDFNKIKDFFYSYYDTFIVLEDNTTYHQEIMDEYNEYNIPFNFSIGEYIIKIIKNVYVTIYLTTKSIYIKGEHELYTILKNKNIINIANSAKTSIALSKDGKVYKFNLRIGKNKNELTTIYNS